MTSKKLQVVETEQSVNENFVDLRGIYDNVLACLIEDEDIELSAYIYAYNELKKFCLLLGTMFGPIGSDISSKVEILNNLVAKNKREDFSSMKKMVEFESRSGKLKDKSYVSGCRTLLRLHRGLGKARWKIKLEIYPTNLIIYLTLQNKHNHIENILSCSDPISSNLPSNEIDLFDLLYN